MIGPVSSTERAPRRKPNRNLTFSSGWNFVLVNQRHINNYGFADDQDYARNSAEPLLAVIGDSYVESLMVPYDESIQGRLAAHASTRSRVYSFSLSGVQLPTYLVFADYARELFRPQSAVFVIISNDFDESWVEYKPTAARQKLTFFKENTDGSVVLETIPYQATTLKRLLRQSALVRYLFFNVMIQGIQWRLADLQREERPLFVGNKLLEADPKRLAASRRAVDVFLGRLPEATGLAKERITFVVDGIRQQIYGDISDEIAETSFFHKMRTYFLSAARARGYEVIDLHPVFKEHFRQHNQRFEFPTDSHWNGLGHELAAAEVRRSRVFSRIISARANAPARGSGSESANNNLTAKPVLGPK